LRVPNHQIAIRQAMLLIAVVALIIPGSTLVFRMARNFYQYRNLSRVYGASSDSTIHENLRVALLRRKYADAASQPWLTVPPDLLPIRSVAALSAFCHRNASVADQVAAMAVSDLGPENPEARLWCARKALWRNASESWAKLLSDAELEASRCGVDDYQAIWWTKRDEAWQREVLEWARGSAQKAIWAPFEVSPPPVPSKQ
jgi:hypothetical protein